MNEIFPKIDLKAFFFFFFEKQLKFYSNITTHNQVLF